MEVIQSVLDQHPRASVVRMVPASANLGIAQN